MLLGEYRPITLRSHPQNAIQGGKRTKTDEANLPPTRRVLRALRALTPAIDDAGGLRRINPLPEINPRAFADGVSNEGSYS